MQIVIDIPEGLMKVIDDIKDESFINQEKSCATCLYCRDGICKDEACVGCFDDPNHSNYEERNSQ